jgi:signal transduction histidine kinase
VGERELKDTLGRMVVEVRRTAEVMHRLRELFASGTTHLEPVEAEELMEAARRIGRRAIGEAPITLDIPAAPPLPTLWIDRVQVELVLRNLLANSAQALAAAARPGLIRVTAERAGEGLVRIRVRDDGPGIAGPTRDRLFEPFVSGKSVGMGMGLAVSRSIAEAHGGALEVASFQPTEFHLTLPCLPAP